jgi:hypothetical protein
MLMFGDWRYSYCNPIEIALSAHRIGVWMIPRVSLHVVAKRNISYPYMIAVAMSISELTRVGKRLVQHGVSVIRD